MKTNYPTKKLGEVVKLNYGKGISRTDRSSAGKYPVYGANGILDYTDKYLIEGEAIIVGRKGSAGEITRASGKFWPSDVTYFVLGNKQIDIDYLFHLFKSLNLQRLAVGVKPGINRNRIYEIEIPLPPLSEQKKIVAKLERVLAKISEAKKLRAEARENADNLLPAELHKIFSTQQHPNKLEYVGMFSSGKKGWQEKELKEIVKKKTSKNTKDGLPFVGMEDVESETGKFLGSLEPKSVKSTTFYFDKESVLYGKLRPYLNKVLLPDFEGHCSTEFIPLKPKDGVSREWVAYWLKSPQVVDGAMSTNTGSRMPRANMKDLMKFKIPLPPLAEQKKIVARLDSLSEKIRTLQEHQTQTASDLTALEQSILFKAFSAKHIL